MHRSLVVTGVVFGAMLALPAAGRGAGEEPSREPTRTFRFTYSVTVQDIPTGAHKVSIWIPVPKTDHHQEVLDLKVKAPLEYEITQEKRYGNRVVHVGAAA